MRDPERNRLRRDDRESPRASAGCLFEDRDQLAQFSDSRRRLRRGDIEKRVLTTVVVWIVQPGEHRAKPFDLRHDSVATNEQQAQLRMDLKSERHAVSVAERATRRINFADRRRSAWPVGQLSLSD